MIGRIERVVWVELVHGSGGIIRVKPIDGIEGVVGIKSVGWVDWII